MSPLSDELFDKARSSAAFTAARTEAETLELATGEPHRACYDPDAGWVARSVQGTLESGNAVGYRSPGGREGLPGFKPNDPIPEPNWLKCLLRAQKCAFRFVDKRSELWHVDLPMMLCGAFLFCLAIVLIFGLLVPAIQYDMRYNP